MIVYDNVTIINSLINLNQNISMPEVTTTTATVASIKIGIFASILAFLEYFGIPKEPFWLLWLLMFIDMGTGVIKQKSVNLYSDPKYFKEITSSRFTFGIVKKLIVLTVICAVGIAIRGLGFEGGELLTWAIAGFITAEIYSIVQNGYIITTGKFLPEWDATGMVLKALANIIKNRLQVQVQEVEKGTPTVEEKKEGNTL